MKLLRSLTEFISPLTSICSGAFLLCACAPLPRAVPFDESAFVRFRKSGSGSYVGKAFTVMRNGNELSADPTDTVKLMPATPYTEEVARVVFEGGKRLQPPDPRFLQYIRKVHPDDDGNFAFHNLPPGDYYVGCHLHWDYPDSSTDGDGNMTEVQVGEKQWIYDHFSIKGGETIKVTEWNQGK